MENVCNMIDIGCRLTKSYSTSHASVSSDVILTEIPEWRPCILKCRSVPASKEMHSFLGNPVTTCRKTGTLLCDSTSPKDHGDATKVRGDMSFYNDIKVLK